MSEKAEDRIADMESLVDGVKRRVRYALSECDRPGSAVARSKVLLNAAMALRHAAEAEAAILATKLSALENEDRLAAANGGAKR